MRMALVVLTAAVVVIASGCNNSTDIVCPADPARVSVSPTSRSMNVGEQFTPTVTAAVCGGTQPYPFVGLYTSANAAVARVDSTRGIITAVAPGETYVFARYTADFGPLGGNRDSIRVTVR